VAGASLAEGIAFLAAAAAHRLAHPGPIARLGDVLFLWFHHVGFDFRTHGRASGPAVLGSGLSFGFTLSLTVLGGTAVACLLLARGGRAVARAAQVTDVASTDRSARGGSVRTLAAGVHGTKVALPYAAACLAAATAARVTVRLPPSAIIPSGLSVHARYVSAVAWPLAIGLVAGFLGAVASERGGPRGPVPAVGQAPRRASRMAVALVGGVRMLSIALIGSFVALLGMAASHPSATAAYFHAVFRRGALRGLTLIAGTALLAPNMAAWVLFPAMGSCLSLGGSRSVCLLSYRHFPAGPAGAGSGGVLGRLLPAGPTGPAPAPYLLFLLVPVVAVVLGGASAAARWRARSRPEAAAAGASAGAVFGLLCAVLVALASIVGGAGAGLGRTVASAFRVGPEPASSVLLALLWGVAGGALGGVARGPEPRSVDASPGPDEGGAAP